MRTFILDEMLEEFLLDNGVIFFLVYQFAIEGDSIGVEIENHAFLVPSDNECFIRIGYRDNNDVVIEKEELRTSPGPSNTTAVAPRVSALHRSTLLVSVDLLPPTLYPPAPDTGLYRQAPKCM